MAEESLTIDTYQNSVELRGSKVGINESKERINRGEGSEREDSLSVVASDLPPIGGIELEANAYL